MANAWGVSWGSSWGVSWGGGIVPPVPVPEWQPAQGSQGGSTMRLARPAGRFGEDHAVYRGTNVPDARTEAIPDDPGEISPADLAEHAELVAQKLNIAAEAAAITKIEQVANARAERLVARETERVAALLAAEQLQIEDDELMMLAIALAAAV